MKITKLLVEDFGKFHQAEFSLGDRVQVWTDGNESGKTTLRQFIYAMWYGLERERGLRARKDEYTRYKPWYSGRFQGRMEFEADGISYRLSRNFLTKEAELLDLNQGRLISDVEGYLHELGLPSPEVYRNTFWIGNECRTEAALAENYRNLMANYACTGGMNLHLNTAKEKLKRQKREYEKQIPERELLLTMEQISKQKELETVFRQQKLQLKELENEAMQAERSIAYWQKELDRAFSLRKELEERKKQRQRGYGIFFGSFLLGLAFFIGVTYLFPLFLLPGAEFVRWIGVAGAFAGAGIGGKILYQNRNPKNGEGQEWSIADLETWIQEVQQELKQAFEEAKETLPKVEKERFAMEQTEERLQACESAKKRYEELCEKKAGISRETEAITLAIDRLEQTSAIQYREYGETFYRELSEYAKAFTDHAYDRLVADEELRLNAITSDRQVDVTDVSYGTGEQFYLALRFAAADVFDPEHKIPMILDDTFTSFDEQRMESALLSLMKSGRQILIFSCTGREEQMLKRMGVSYEKVFKKTGKRHMERD